MKKLKLASYLRLNGGKRKVRHLITAFVGLVALVLIPVVIYQIRKPNQTQAAWYNDNWQYRQKIPVTAHTGAETNVYFTPNTFDSSDTGKFQTDCGDLRFTDANGKQLPYYISSGCGTGTTTVHVLVSNFPAGAQDFYMYYGNPTAENGFSAADFSTAATGVTLGSNGSEENAPAPVASWKFDEGSDNTCSGGSNDACDSSANQNDLANTSANWQTGDCVFRAVVYILMAVVPG